MHVDDQLALGAQRALRRYGLAGATLERIAAEAGVSRMTLHRRGIGRPELLSAVVRRMADAERAALWPALTAEGDGATRLRLALEAECAVAEDHLEVLEAMDAAARDELFHGADGLTRAEFVEPLRRLLSDGVHDGTLRSEDPAEDATVLFNLVGHTYRHLRAGHGWAPGRAREAVLRIALDGVRAR
jgi:AcrR family transcriptional regulator